MKTKYFLSMLLGGALLTACTADDFESAPVAQEVNQAAPIFVVSFDDDLQNRAGWANNAPSFVEDDEMTLFHGIPTTTSTWTGWQRAIYTGGTESDGAFEFKTFSMVVPGYAVMTYPADKNLDIIGDGTSGNTWGLGTTAPTITVSDKQDKTTKTNTPYVSAVLNIGKTATTDGKTAQAGYGEKYNIVLRRIASTLDVQMHLDNVPENVEGAEDFKIKSVTLTTKEGTGKGFVKQMTIKGGEDYTGDQLKKAWAKKSELTAVDETKVAAITTSDIAEEKEYTKATFTLLPVNTKEEDGDLDECTVVVETNYGTVTFDKDAEIWNTKAADKTSTTTLQYLFDALWKETAEGKAYAGEIAGTRAGANVNIDFDGLEMTEMHVTTGDELKSTLAIYDALYDGEELTVYLDGDDDGVFSMDDTALDAMVAHVGANSKVKFVACQDHNECSIVAINNSGDEEKEIPSMKFDTNEVDVQLTGAWKFTDVTVLSGNNSNLKTLTKVKGISVESGSLKLENHIKVSDGLSTSGITIKNGVVVDVVGSVNVYTKLNNYGEIYINADRALYANEGGEINNMPIARDEKGNVNGMTNSTEKKGGYIENEGTLGVNKDAATTASVNNYGVIKVIGQFADTKLTTNEQSSASLTTAYNGTAVFGTIILPDGNINKLTDVKSGKGFIKLHVKADYPLDSDVKGGNANCLVLDNGCTKLTTDAVSNKAAFKMGEGNIQYIEIGTANNVLFEGTTNKYTLNALIIPQGKVTAVNGVEIQITETTGTVYLGKNGTLSTGKLTSGSSSYDYSTTAGKENYFGKNEGTYVDTSIN